ncbi:hypothetical protein GCM10010220_15950 [Streptomyces parvulus]|nr:hypothetical protein GCM10010220_15950 [Streptomyces parvulus]
MDSYALEATSETWTPAHKAVETSDYETLSTLPDSGTDPDEVCFGHTLLAYGGPRGNTGRSGAGRHGRAQSTVAWWLQGRSRL